MIIINGAGVVSSAVPVTDSFDRADSGSLGNADTGQTWSVHGTAGIISNLARFTALGSGPIAGLAWIDSGGSDGVLEVTFTTLNNTIGLLFRLTDENNYLMLNFDGGSGWRVQKREAGSLGTIASFAGGLTNGDVIKVTLTGSSIDCEKNAVALGSTSSSFNQSATKHGFGCHGNVGHRWNDFSYTP